MEGTPSETSSKAELLALIGELQRQLAVRDKQVAALTSRIAELEKKNPTTRLDESYSVNAEEKRRDQRAQKRKKSRKQKSARRGRISTAEKLAQATVHENMIPAGLTLECCKLRYSRPVWRIIDGHAERVAYHVYAGSDGRVPQIPGVPKRGEYGVEILTAVAFQHYITGLSLDKVAAELAFFWDLHVRKSQLDAMLNQLQREWLPEFDRLCELLAVSAVVYTDETGWSINSVWAFLSEKVRITLFGCRKDGATLQAVLNKLVFEGILVSDDAAVYQGFSRAQKCWAHLLRKAIRLTLLKPRRPRYRRFLDALLDIFRRGKAIAADQRLSEAGRRKRVDSLVNAICECTGDRFVDKRTPQDDAEKDFYNLSHEIVRLMNEDELFTFVIHPETAPTNNGSEQHLRQPAKDRDTCRGSKTVRGGRRRTVIVSVLDSLRLYLPRFTLRSILDELNRWREAGASCFRKLVESLSLPARDSCEENGALLNRLIPEATAG
ncbi:MAG: transposase [Acidobacteria bacterium]|nr:transposase [Acidobacteriota bacterium]